VLTAQAAGKAVNPGPMADYLNAFRFGCPPHGGLGMGLGRVLMVLLGLESIRDATFLFRGPPPPHPIGCAAARGEGGNRWFDSCVVTALACQV
jgi:hypothetical protein